MLLQLISTPLGWLRDKAAAKAQEVTLETYSIIYELIDGVRKNMEDLLEPIRTERKLGRAEVRQTIRLAIIFKGSTEGK